MKKLFFLLCFMGSLGAIAQSRVPYKKSKYQKEQKKQIRRSAAAYQGTFYGNTQLVQDRFYYSANQQYYFNFQNDGNLVVYRADGQSLWSSGTENRGASALFQGDGNLVIKDGSGGIVWDAFANQAQKNRPAAMATENAAATRTRGNRTALVMQDDGNLVIYTGKNRLIKWASDTNR